MPRKASKVCPADLTTTQWAYVRAIRDLTLAAGYPPTYLEVAHQMGERGDGAIERAKRACDRLEILGYVTRKPRSARTLRLTERGEQSL